MCYMQSVSRHYADVMMGAIASQITSLRIVYSTVYIRRRSKKTSKLRVTGLCVGNSPGTGEFPAQSPVTREMFPFDDVIMICRFNSWWRIYIYASFNKLNFGLGSALGHVWQQAIT